MSIPAFILRALLISPIVFARYLPILLIFVLVVVGLFLATSNIWVIGMIVLILSTMGTSFLILNGIRAGLMTIRATTAPTAGGLLRATGRMLMTHLLVQLIMSIVLGAIVYYVAFTVVIPAAVPGAENVIRPFIAALVTFDSGAMAELMPQMEQIAVEADRLVVPGIVINVMMASIGALCVAIFGVPMAALAATAVHYAPEHDLIYGMGRYGVHQFLLYMLAVALPGALWILMAPGLALGFEGEPSLVLAGAVALWSIYAPCISYGGMAIAYEGVRNRLAAERRAMSVPDIDYEAEREQVRNLRQTRNPGADVHRVYDPRRTE
ncbi:hypothetical protein HMH01_04545 [Halovulum dunhuangense]|uniref:Uncharacterized protein n=1 Tax=Halovulum dunhuangense TaxID=1505036 RepID=A0A849L0B5_9RHOB|nr:hypothetical protein [Halovulum dunhuangense]NNU79705.1 hypothetical protein [Halovulum dunhuangense]